MTQDFESASTCQTSITLATLDTMNREKMLQIRFDLSNLDHYGHSGQNI